MIYSTLQEALEADPKKKGVALFVILPKIRCFERFIWGRSKRDALGIWAGEAAIATKYHAGANVESDGEVPTILKELF